MKLYINYFSERRQRPITFGLGWDITYPHIWLNLNHAIQRHVEDNPELIFWLSIKVHSTDIPELETAIMNLWRANGG